MEKSQLSYFQGCSNGGRQALMEAQRYQTTLTALLLEHAAIQAPLNGEYEREWAQSG